MSGSLDRTKFLHRTSSHLARADSWERIATPPNMINIPGPGRGISISPATITSQPSVRMLHLFNIFMAVNPRSARRLAGSPGVSGGASQQFQLSL